MNKKNYKVKLKYVVVRVFYYIYIQALYDTVMHFGLHTWHYRQSSMVGAGMLSDTAGIVCMGRNKLTTMKNRK